MLKDIYANLQLNKYDIRGGAWLILGLFLFGEVLGTILMAGIGDEEYLSIGMILAVGAAGLMPLVIGMAQYCTGFELALKSGATRHRYMRSQTIVSIVQCIMAIGLVLVCWLIDMGFYKLFFSGAVNFDIIKAIPLWVYAAAPLILTALALIFGMVLAKFGKKASFGFLAIYFIGFFVVGRGDMAIRGEGTNILDKIIFALYNWVMVVGIVPVLWICAGILAVLAAVSYLVLLRLPVKA